MLVFRLVETNDLQNSLREPAGGVCEHVICSPHDQAKTKGDYPGTHLSLRGVSMFWPCVEALRKLLASCDTIFGKQEKGSLKFASCGVGASGLWPDSPRPLPIRALPTFFLWHTANALTGP